MSDGPQVPAELVEAAPAPIDDFPVPEAAQLDPSKPVRLKADGTPDRRAFTSKFHAIGHGKPPKLLSAEQAVAAVSDVLGGMPLQTATVKAGLSRDDRDKIAKLVDCTPEEFQSRLADRMENILEALSKRLEQNTSKIKYRDLCIQIAILTDKLTALRGSRAPQATHVTNIQINGLDRASALKMLAPRAVLPTEPVNVSPP